MYSAVRLYRTGETGRNATIGRPTDVRIRKTMMLLNGSVASTSSQMRPIWIAEGWHTLDIEAEVRNYTTGYANGATAGIFVGGSTTSQVQNGVIALKYLSLVTSDTTPHIIYLNGAVGVAQWLRLSVDLSEAYTTTNQIPWDIPSTLRSQIIIDQVTPPRLSTAYNSLKPERIVTVTTSPYNANHADRVILVSVGSTSTVNLPVTNSGNALAVPRPGAGTRMTIKDTSGAAGTNAITLNAASGETIDGVASKTISSNYGVVNLVSTGTGWAIL